MKRLGLPAGLYSGFMGRVGSLSRVAMCFMMRGLRVTGHGCSVWVGCCRVRQRL